MEKIFDKTSKKYLENLFKDYIYNKRGFQKPKNIPKILEGIYFEFTNNGFQSFDASIVKNKWGYYDCYLVYAKRIETFAKVYNEIFYSTQDEDVQIQTVSIMIGGSKLKELYNYDDGIITTGGEFEMYDYEDADRYFAASIKIFEQFAEPFFKQIQTVEDVDMWYNKKIYEGDIEFIESAKILKNNLFDTFAWWKGLIASRLAKNKDYDLLENTIKEFSLYWEQKASNPALLNVFYQVTNYFKENNL